MTTRSDWTPVINQMNDLAGAFREIGQAMADLDRALSDAGLVDFLKDFNADLARACGMEVSK